MSNSEGKDNAGTDTNKNTNTNKNKNTNKKRIDGVGMTDLGGGSRLNDAVKALVQVILDEVTKEMYRLEKTKGPQSNAIMLANLNAVTLQTIDFIIKMVLETEKGALLDMLQMLGHLDKAGNWDTETMR